MIEFQSNQPPPFATIPTPNQVSLGETYYDADTQRMTEIYRDRCIRIFPTGNDFSCQFLSDRERTFLIRFPLHDLSHPNSCCRWSAEPFWAPRTDVLRNFAYQQQLKFGDEPVNFFLLDIPLPGPFGYGVTAREKRPAAFWFPVIDAWVQQNFAGFSPDRPDPRVFAVPAICDGPAPVCD